LEDKEGGIRDRGFASFRVPLSFFPLFKAETMKKLELIMLRHGVTDHNTGLRLTGWGDPELNPTGLQQAEDTAKELTAKFKFEAIYTSTLKRAIQTAAPFVRLTGLTPVRMDSLKEYNFGEMEGRTIQEMKEHFPEMFAAWRKADEPDFSWPGGEKRSVFHGRVDTAIWEISRAEIQQGHKLALIVGHGAALAGFVTEILTGNPLGWREYLLENCQHYHIKIVYDPAKPIEKQSVRMEVVSMGTKLEWIPGT
jgi:glucosyl-3-phosphoglycerate phosphatase